ncbi:hypothetical protein WNY98_17325 [Pseudoalteromonas sp. AS71]|uniref:hypothetical protein n=1 Tax=Pseudoalteromonas sp. AS71 TaxID=3135777 RepID=UPI0031734DAD
MKIDAHSLPDDPEQLKRMLLELQQIVAKKDKKLAEKDAQVHELLQAYNAKLAKEYAKKSERCRVLESASMKQKTFLMNMIKRYWPHRP